MKTLKLTYGVKNYLYPFRVVLVYTDQRNQPSQKDLNYQLANFQTLVSTLELSHEESQIINSLNPLLKTKFLTEHKKVLDIRKDFIGKDFEQHADYFAKTIIASRKGLEEYRKYIGKASDEELYVFLKKGHIKTMLQLMKTQLGDSVVSYVHILEIFAERDKLVGQLEHYADKIIDAIIPLVRSEGVQILNRCLRVVAMLCYYYEESHVYLFESLGKVATTPDQIKIMYFVALLDSSNLFQTRAVLNFFSCVIDSAGTGRSFLRILTQCVQCDLITILQQIKLKIKEKKFRIYESFDEYTNLDLLDLNTNACGKQQKVYLQNDTDFAKLKAEVVGQIDGMIARFNALMKGQLMLDTAKQGKKRQDLKKGQFIDKNRSRPSSTKIVRQVSSAKQSQKVTEKQGDVQNNQPRNHAPHSHLRTKHHANTHIHQQQQGAQLIEQASEAEHPLTNSKLRTLVPQVIPNNYQDIIKGYEFKLMKKEEEIENMQAIVKQLLHMKNTELKDQLIHSQNQNTRLSAQLQQARQTINQLQKKFVEMQNIMVSVKSMQTSNDQLHKQALNFQNEISNPEAGGSPLLKINKHKSQRLKAYNSVHSITLRPSNSSKLDEFSSSNLPPPPPAFVPLPPNQPSVTNILQSLNASPNVGSLPLLPPPPPPPPPTLSVTTGSLPVIPPALGVGLPPPLLLLPPPPSLSLNIMTGPTRKPKQPTTTEMKSLQWTVIQKADTKGSIWQSLNQPQVNIGQIENLFKLKKAVSNNTNSQGGSSQTITQQQKKKQKKLLTTNERAKNIQIIIQKLKLNISKLRQNLYTLNQDVLDYDTVVSMLEIVPIPAQVEIFADSAFNQEQLLLPDRYLYVATHIKGYEYRLRSLVFKHDFPQMQEQYSRKLAYFKQFFEDMIVDPLLKKILEYVMAVGNVLNSGNSRGGVYGFRSLETLDKCFDIKYSTSEKSNLVTYVLTLIKEKEPELLRWQPKSASNYYHQRVISLKVLSQDLKEFKESVNRVQKCLLSCEEGVDDRVQECFFRCYAESLKKVKEFETNIKTAQEVFKKAQSAYKQVGDSQKIMESMISFRAKLKKQIAKL